MNNFRNDSIGNYLTQNATPQSRQKKEARKKFLTKTLTPPPVESDFIPLQLHLPLFFLLFFNKIGVIFRRETKHR